MIITCGQCQAKFKVAPEQIKVTGSKVRCSNCLCVFTVYRPGGPETETQDPASPLPPAEDPGLFQDGDSESLKARRERRRRLYTSEEEDDLSAYEDDEDWVDAGVDEASGRPPLRRRPTPAEPPADEDVHAEPPAEEAGEPEEEEPEPSPDEAGPDLGLAADPTRPPQAVLRQVGDDDVDLPLPGASASYGGEARAAVTRVKGRRNGLFLGLAIFCAALAIGLFYLGNRPEPRALSAGDDPPPIPAASAQPGGGDPRGIEHITFTPKDNLKHFYRKNEKEGELLIITGRVRNSYPKPRSFIRLRGLLLDQNGNTLADRFIYAGNIIAEDDLLTLPKDEIMTRLNIKGGQNNQNVNIAPGQEVPFMVVFDKVPPNKDEYRIIPVGSSPAE